MQILHLSYPKNKRKYFVCFGAREPRRSHQHTTLLDSTSPRDCQDELSEQKAWDGHNFNVSSFPGTILRSQGINPYPPPDIHHALDHQELDQHSRNPPTFTVPVQQYLVCIYADAKRGDLEATELTWTEGMRHPRGTVPISNLHLELVKAASSVGECHLSLDEQERHEGPRDNDRA